MSGRRRGPNRNGLFFTTLFLCCTMASYAQVSLGNGDQGASSTPQLIEDPEQIVETAFTSFVSTAEGLFERALEQQESVPENKKSMLQESIGKEVAGFKNAVRAAVIEMQGDGIITLSEISGRLEELRYEHLTRIEEQLKAELTGERPPPKFEESEGLDSYTGELLRYTLVERNSPLTWGLLLGAILLGVIMAGLLSVGLKRTAKALGNKKSSVLSTLAHSLRGPLYLVATMIGVATGLHWIWMPIAVADVVWIFVRLAFVLGVFWFFWNLAGAMASIVGWAAARTRTRLDNQMVDFCRRGFRLCTLVIFVLFITEVMFDTDFRGLLAGIGIAGLAVTLASQDTLKNLIGFFTIYADTPFRMGDYVAYKQYFGPIEEIGFRSTTLRTLEGHLVSIPNAEMVKETIENVSARRGIRMKFYVDIVYATSPAKIREAVKIAADIVAKYEGRTDDDSPHVFFESFGDSSYRIYIQYYYEPAKYWEAFEDGTEVKCQLIEQYEAAGIEFAFPTRTLYLEGQESFLEGRESAPDPELEKPSTPKKMEPPSEDVPGEPVEEDDGDGDDGGEAR